MLTFRQRQKAGITIARASAAMEALRDAGEIDASTSNPELAVLILSKLKAENPEGFGEGIDLDSILSFLEMLIPLLKLLVLLV